MKELGERFLWGLAGAALCSGTALVNELSQGQTIGWALVGFAIGTVADLVIMFICGLLG